MELSQDHLQQLANVCWGEVTRFLKPDSCVLATRVFCDVLEALGERLADGMAVCAIVLSPATVEHGRVHGCASDEHLVLSCPQLGPRAAAVLGADPDAPSHGLLQAWPGHVAAVVRRRWLVDLSLPQVHCPEDGRVIDSPLVVEMGRAFFGGGLTADMHEESGMRLLYRALPRARADWRDSPDWALRSDMRRQLGLGTLARFQGKQYRYSDDLLRIFALTGKV